MTPAQQELQAKLIDLCATVLRPNAIASDREPIAHYDCPSTAMCYTMHIGAVAGALFRAHENPELQQLLKRLDKDVLIGSLSYSDPETGSHFWYPIDVGMRVADYPTIQDYFGEAIIDTNACRSFVFSMGKLMDELTHQCDWSIHTDITTLPRAEYLPWYWQIKFAAAKSVAMCVTKCSTLAVGLASKKIWKLNAICVTVKQAG